MKADHPPNGFGLDARLAPILQLANVAIVDCDSAIVAVSDPICDMLGYSAVELVGRNSRELNFPPDLEVARDLMRRAIAGGIKTYSVEKRFVRKGGDVFWALVTGTALSAPGLDSPQYLVVLLQDIDARKKAEIAADAAESRWGFALDSAGQGVWDCRVDEGRTFYSATWKAILGYEEDELSDAADLWQTLLHPEDVAKVVALDQDHLAGRTPYFECEFRMRHKKGHWVWVLDRGKVVERDASGRPTRMIGTYTDISALKASEELHRETAEQYRLLADNVTDMILRVRKSGRRIYVSPASRRLLGYEPEEMLNISTTAALHPDDVAALTETWVREFESEDELTLTYRMRRKDNEYIWVESISRALPVTQGRPAERLLVVRNIDKRVAAEERLKDSEARYRLLAEQASDMVFQLDADLVRQYVSPASREILGYEPHELLGRTPVAMAHPEDADRVAAAYRTLMSGELDRASISKRIRHHDGHWVWVDAELRLLRNSQSGEPSGILGSLRDASKRKEAEARLQRDNRQLASQVAKDGLTGLFNRRAFDQSLGREFRRCARSSAALALVMIDVDRFKAFNDIYGHPAGDAVLRAVSATIADALQRPGDLAARYGGEEFAVLLPDTDEAGAVEVAERVRLAVKCSQLIRSAIGSDGITISAGAAAILPRMVSSGPTALVAAADRALYAAKHGGRDAVIAATSFSEKGDRPAFGGAPIEPVGDMELGARTRND